MLHLSIILLIRVLVFHPKPTIYNAIMHVRDSFVDSFNDLNQIACYHSNVADDARHAAYLSVLPKKAYFAFLNEEMLIFRRLLYLNIHLHLPGIS